MVTYTEDDWRSETQSGLSKSLIYKELVNKCQSDVAGTHVLSLIDDAVYYAYQRTKMVLINMGEYTLHDGDHLFRVLRLMERLLPDVTLKSLSVPELMLLILTAFYHDIGMAPSLNDVIIWNKYWGVDEINDEEKQQFEAFKKYCNKNPTLVAEIERFYKTGANDKAELLKKHLISGYIRATHSFRARTIIEKDWIGRVKYRDFDLTDEFAQLCYSHNEDPASLQDFDTSLLCGPGVYVCLPFIGVILRLADILDFDAKRTPAILYSHLTIRNPVSLQEWKKHRSVDAWDISNTIIRFNVRCEHPAIELAIHEFCDLIDIELAAGNTILARLNDSIRIPFPEYYKFNLPLTVDRSKIGAVKKHGKPIYNYQDTKFSLNKSQVIDLLMGTKLYGSPDVALRELIQNSIDACLLRQAMSKSWNDLSYEPKITVKFYKDQGEDCLEVIDNGTGMDIDIINKYYSSVGTSYYQSSDFHDLKTSISLDYTPISRFGIGILSCFMVSDTLAVNTKRLKGKYESGEAYEIIVEGYDSIFWVRDGSIVEPGTTTKLILRENHPWRYLTEDQLIDSIPKIIPHPPFPIEISTPERNKIHTGEQFKNLNLDDIKGYKWKSDSTVIEISFELDDNDFGIVGKGIVAILQKGGNPVSKIDLLAKEVNVDGNDYTLDRSIRLNVNEIEKVSKSIEVDDEGETNLNNSTTTLASSKAIIALHGIEIPFNIFPDYWAARTQKVQLKWPLPVLLIIDIIGKSDLNLNSARTEILFDEKWLEFEENLAFLICENIYKSISHDYWLILNGVMKKNTNSPEFLAAIKKLNLQLGINVLEETL